MDDTFPLSKLVFAALRVQRAWPLFLCVLFAPEMFDAQTPAVTVCFVQTREVHENFVASGGDAKALASEFAGATLRNGTPVVPVVVTGLGDKDVIPEVERRGCGWVVQVWHHDSVDVNQLSSPPANIDIVPEDPAPAPTIGDRSAIVYRLRRAGVKKVIAEGSAPPRTVRGRTGGVIFDPYALFAKQILKKLNELE